MRSQSAFLIAFNTWLYDTPRASLRSLLTVNGHVNIFLNQAPQDVKTPYMVYSIVPGPALTYTYSSGNVDRVRLQVSFFTEDVNNGGNLSQIIPASVEFEKQFDSISLTLTDNIEMTCTHLESNIILNPRKEKTQISTRWYFDTYYDS